jgi:hypothetical protein
MNEINDFYMRDNYEEIMNNFIEQSYIEAIRDNNVDALKEINEYYNAIDTSYEFIKEAIENNAYNAFVWLYENGADYDIDLIPYALSYNCKKIAVYLFKKGEECCEEHKKIIKDHIDNKGGKI